MSSRFMESQQPPPYTVVYMLMKKSLNYSISKAEDDKLLPKGRQKKKNVLMDLRVRNSQAIHYTSLWG